MTRPKVEYKKSETSKRQVLDAAIKAFARHGFADTSVSDIAAAAGMSKGVVHYHFDSKGDLIANVLEECCARMSVRARDAWALPGSPTDKIRRALREMWAARTDGSPETRVLTELMAQGVHDAKTRKSLSIRFHATREELVREFVGAFTSIGLRPKVPAHVIPRLVTATLDGLGLHQLFDPLSADEEKDVMRALEVLAFALFEL